VSDFYGLNIALSALRAQQQALDTAGHNIANANTEGYSRQRVDMVANGAPAAPVWQSRWEGAGAGVSVVGIRRLRDDFLEARGLQEHATDAGLKRTSSILGQVESALSEPSDNGIQAALADLWSAWDDVANQPEDAASRTQLVQRAQTLAGALNATAAAVGSLRSDALDQLSGPRWKFVGGHAAVARGPASWAARRSRRSLRSLVV
jgi:flagellar hook-associated protein 1